MTLSRTRNVDVPAIRLPAPVRVGVVVFQRMLTDGSSACVPESSICVVFAWLDEGQIMLNAQAKKKAMSAGRGAATITANSAYSGQCR